jgi:hypothetical protein
LAIFATASNGAVSPENAILEVEAEAERRLHRRMLDDDRGDLDVVILRHRSGRRHFLHVDGNQWLHFEILGPEIDRRLVGTHEILGHLFERRRPEGAHVKMHAIDPADH